jgi:3D (Asp-Asp-Asp) domain-containing protein
MKHKYLSIAIMPISLAVIGTAFLLHEKPYPTEPAATIESTPTESTPAPEATETKPKPVRTEEFIVTAYAYTGSRTATGVWPEEGMCASDWNVLPPGSIVNIPGYGIAVVTDRVEQLKATD